MPNGAPSFEEMLAQDRERARDRFINERRVSSLVDETFADTGIRDDLEVKADGSNVTVDPDGFLEDEEFQTFRDNVSEIANFTGTSSGGKNVVAPPRVEDDLPPDPMEVHESRSEYAQKQDEARSARLTDDPELYARDPNSFDFPGVDVPEDSEGSSSTTVSGFRDLF
jgi:hypothetical protein